MWFAGMWTEVSDGRTPDLANPQSIRKWFSEQTKDTPPSPELTIETPSRLTASIEVVAPIAAKVNKLVSMAQRGEGQEKAAALPQSPRHLEAPQAQLRHKTTQRYMPARKMRP